MPTQGSLPLSTTGSRKIDPYEISEKGKDSHSKYAKWSIRQRCVK